MIQKQLLSEILKREIGIWDAYEGTNVIGNRLHDKRVLAAFFVRLWVL